MSSEWKKVRLGDMLICQPKSKIKAGEGAKTGKYKFFSSSKERSKFIDKQTYTSDAIIIGTGGNANIHYCSEPFSSSTDCLVYYANEGVFIKTLYYYLSGNIHILQNGFKGAGLKHISKSYIDEIRLNFPSFTKQRQIAEVLDKATELLSMRKHQLAELDALAESVFYDMFGDPVKNEKGWDVIRWSVLFETRLGKMLDKKKQILTDIRVPYLGNSNVLWGDFDSENLNYMTFSERERCQLKLKNGDLLICEGGEAGRCAIWLDETNNVLFQKAIHRARVRDKSLISAIYTQKLLYEVKHRGGLKKYISKSTIEHLTGQKLNSLLIPVPPIELQNQFAKIIEKIEKQKEQVRNAISESEDLFQKLMQDLFK